MISLLERIKPDLTDFILLALLQMFMHILTVLEVGRGDTRSTPTADFDRASAATWSFVGVLLTLVIGILAQAISDLRIEAGAWALAVPLFFIGRWAFFHWRISKLLEGSIIENEVRNFYREAILNVFNEAGVNGLSLEEIAARMLPHLKQARILYENAGLFKRFVPVSVGTLFDRYLPTADNLKPILEELSAKKMLSIDNERYFKSQLNHNKP